MIITYDKRNYLNVYLERQNRVREGTVVFSSKRAKVFMLGVPTKQNNIGTIVLRDTYGGGRQAVPLYRR